MNEVVRVTVWNECGEETGNGKPYPYGMHRAIADYLNKQPNVKASTALIGEPEQGLTQETLDNTDVLIWWGHARHNDVKDELVDRIHQRVLDGMGLIVLHSAHYSKIFKKLMGTTCSLKWREIGEKERVWVIDPGHPIANGLPEYFEIPCEEMYGERFDIPQPDELVFVSWFAGGEVFRSGCCWHRGKGRVFYFRPGHETYPVYSQEEVLKVIYNATLWAKTNPGTTPTFGHFPEPLEDIKPLA